MIKSRAVPDGRRSSSPTNKSKDAIIAYAAEHAKLNRKIPRAKGAWRVLLNLYLGNAAAAGDAATLRQLKVTAVQSVGPLRKSLPWGNTLALMRVAIQDNDEAHILPFLEEACTWIGELAKEEGVVLVLPGRYEPLGDHGGGFSRGVSGDDAAEAMAGAAARPAARFGRGEEGVLQRDLRQWALDCAVARESREQDGQGCVDGEAEKEPAPTGEAAELGSRFM